MKKLFLFFCLIALNAAVHAQNAVAKIKYEQAEEAFAKDDYAVTLIKLDEAQKILGSTNPKILYLRLMAAKGIVATGKFDWNFLETARKDAAYYIRQYSEMQGIEEKFRQVYEFSETLEALPKTKNHWDEKQAQAMQAYKEWLKQRPVKISDSLLTVYRVKKCATLEEFLAFNPGALNGLKKFKHPTPSITKAYSSGSTTSAGPNNVWFDGKGLFYYSYIVQGDTDPATAKNIYQSLVDLYPPGLEKEVVVRTEISSQNNYESGSLMVMPATTGNRGSILIMYFAIFGKAYVQISFHLQHSAQ